MSNGYENDLDTEYDDSYDDAELFDEGIYDDESAKSRARKRRVQVQAANMRRAKAAASRRAASQAAGRRPGRQLPPTAPPRAVVSAVKELDLQSQVQEEKTRTAFATQNGKIDRANMAAVATLLIGEGFRAFGTPDNALLRAGIQASPLLVLAPGSSRPGIEGVIRHPAFAGGVGALGLAFIGDRQKKGESVQTVTIVGPRHTSSWPTSWTHAAGRPPCR
jgi:hypothetical protein